MSDAVYMMCQSLKRQYKGKELLLKLAQVTADEWLDMYQYKPFYRDEPAILQRYRKMTPKEKEKLNKDNPNWLNEDEEMKSYAKQKRSLEIENASNRQYLEQTLQELVNGDPARCGKVEAVLSKYPTSKVRVATVEWDSKSQPAGNVG